MYNIYLYSLFGFNSLLTISPLIYYKFKKENTKDLQAISSVYNYF